MNSKVTVAGDAASNSVIVVSENNPEFGHVKLEQTRSIIDDNGFLKRKVTSTLIHGNVDELRQMNFFIGQELPGNILVKESLEPFNKKNPEREMKVAGDTGIVCTFEGNPIYRKTYYSASANAQDLFIQHDNVEELRTAYARSKAVNSEVLQNAGAGDFDI
jgi:hypothetical protein